MDQRNQKYLTKEEVEKQLKLEEELKKDAQKKLWQQNNFKKLQEAPKKIPKPQINPQIPQNLT